MISQVSHILAFFALPSHLMMTLIVTGTFLLWINYPKTAKILLTTGTVGLLVLGFSPLGQAVILPLEERFPRADPSQIIKPAGIIVLGGGVDPRISKSRDQATMNAAGERIIAGIQLHRQFPSSKLIYTGGAGGENPEQDSEAFQFRQHILPIFGIPPHKVVFEHHSRNTFENAWFTRELLAPGDDQTWIIVTSAYHMPRAMGTFRKAGFHALAWPTDYRTQNKFEITRPFSRMFNGLRRTDTAVREWLALWFYWMAGKTDNLFPGPNKD